MGKADTLQAELKTWNADRDLTVLKNLGVGGTSSRRVSSGNKAQQTVAQNRARTARQPIFDAPNLPLNPHSQAVPPRKMAAGEFGNTIEFLGF